MKCGKEFLICFCNLIYLAATVNISRLKSMPNYNSTSSAIGPRCSESRIELEGCTLDNGKIGICTFMCSQTEIKYAKACCHDRFPTALTVYFCCEKTALLSTVGGVRTQEYEFPYMAALGWYSTEKLWTYDYKCDGALVSKKFVLTAAHCAYYNGIEPVVVLPGGVNLTGDFNNYLLTIETVHVHPDYDDDFVYNDIALIELVGEYTGITIDLWRRSYIANTSFTALGYGDTKIGGKSSDVLSKVFLDYVATDDCQQFYTHRENVPSGIINTQICAKDPKNIMDTCQGDSGGPLIMTTYSNNGDQKKEYLIGITSFGQGCALSPPGVYTYVPAYIDWIKEYVKNYINTASTVDNKRHWT